MCSGPSTQQFVRYMREVVRVGGPGGSGVRAAKA